MTDTGADMMMCCASCGIAEVDNTKLRTCTACKSVRYCSVECQKEHRPQHKRACKKRAAELHDEILFKQPESSNKGDCPICFLPLSLDVKKSKIYSCCSKLICNGCGYAAQGREDEERLKHKCPFCRQPVPDTGEEMVSYVMKRVEANDPLALITMAVKCRDKGDHGSAFEYLTKAAGLGHADAHYQLSVMYDDGIFVEKDIRKALYHKEEAAIGGHAYARYNLACEEWNSGRTKRGVKHWIIAANLGCDDSIEALKKTYSKGLVRKEDFAAALRAHQAAVDATKSTQRDDVEAFLWDQIQQNIKFNRTRVNQSLPPARCDENSS